MWHFKLLLLSTTTDTLFRCGVHTDPCAHHSNSTITLNPVYDLALDLCDVYEYGKEIQIDMQICIIRQKQCATFLMQEYAFLDKCEQKFASPHTADAVLDSTFSNLLSGLKYGQTKFRFSNLHLILPYIENQLYIYKICAACTTVQAVQ